MKNIYLSLLPIALVWACKGSSTGPQVPALDPPAAVHIINQTGVDFNAWTVIIGSDLNHSGLAQQGFVVAGSTTICLLSGSVTGERRFVEAAVIPGSRLDSLLAALTSAGPRRDAFADSLARGFLTPAALLAAYPGLVTATLPFDPAPSGFAPTDTVPWKWTATATLTSAVIVDTSDHACRH